ACDRRIPETFPQHRLRDLNLQSEAEMSVGPTVRGRPRFRYSAPVVRLFSRRCRLGRGVLGRVQDIFKANLQFPASGKVVLIEKALPVVEVKIREPNLMWIIIEAGSARVSNAVILAVNMKTVQMLPTPGEQDLENVVQAGEMDIAWDEQASPDQRTDITKYNTKLVSNGVSGVSIHPGSL